jgi:hypothetical protein
VNVTGLNRHKKILSFFNIIITFLLACFAWIFFRANSVKDAWLIIKKMATFSGPLHYENPSMLIFSFLGIGMLFLYELKHEYFRNSISLLNNQHWLVRNMTYAVLIILILLIGVFDGGQFIYFQF